MTPWKFLPCFVTASLDEKLSGMFSCSTEDNEIQEIWITSGLKYCPISNRCLLSRHMADCMFLLLGTG